VSFDRVATMDDLKDFLSRPKPAPLDLSPNPHLPFLERELQASLLALIDTFATIAHQLDQLGERRTDGEFPGSAGRLYIDHYRDMWGDAMTAAFSQVISQVNWHGNPTCLESRSKDRTIRLPTMLCTRIGRTC